MINEEALRQIDILEKEYEKTWGKKVNYAIRPRDITQEALVPILKIMIEDGCSLLVAYNRYKSK